MDFKSFNFRYLYIAPALIVLLGIMYGRSQEALVGGAAIALGFIISIALLIGLVTYHITRKLLWSILSIPILFVILLLIVKNF